MKIRSGFVSNSSSSSFILATPEPITRGFLEREYGGRKGWICAYLGFLEDCGHPDELDEPWEYQPMGMFGHNDGRTPVEIWKDENKVPKEWHITEYLTSNWGDDDDVPGYRGVVSGLYYNGVPDFLATPNIKVFMGSRWG